MERVAEVDAKLTRVREWLAAQDADGLLFATHGGFAWITGGGHNHVNVATERGSGGVLVTRDGVVLLADNIERARLLEEELVGIDWPAAEFPWWTGSVAEAALKRVPKERLISDIPVPGARPLGAAEAVKLRNPLMPVEIERYRVLGEQVGVVLTHVAFHCRPGLSEHQLAGMLAGGLMDWGIVPAVTLVAVDERVHTRRHPIPTARRLERYAMLVVTARRHGLHLSATRLVHFGPVPADLLERSRACAQVDAAYLAATRPGAGLADVFAAGQAAYAAAGYPGEWERHHQGGPTGYAGRDLKGSPFVKGTVEMAQAFAWNPSITGVKSEDTVLVTPEGIELLSPTPDLPLQAVEAGEQVFHRPAILER